MDKCQVCGKPLAKFKTIVAAGGHLFCSDKCGKRWWLAEMTSEFVLDYEDLKEYVNPKEIGICQ